MTPKYQQKYLGLTIKLSLPLLALQPFTNVEVFNNNIYIYIYIYIYMPSVPRGRCSLSCQKLNAVSALSYLQECTSRTKTHEQQCGLKISEDVYDIF